MLNIQINASIVLYHNKIDQLKKVINSFLNTDLKVKLYLIDNSSNDKLKELEKIDNRIEYLYNNSNMGYGKAHNIAIKKSIKEGVKYHVVLNPDLYFDNKVIDELYAYMESHNNVGNIIPKVLYPNGEVQNLCKLLPTPLNWFGRFISNYIKLDYFQHQNELFEMKFANKNNILNIPYMSGAFMFLRMESIKKSGLFDENIFLHTEDTDLSRRMYKASDNVYYPHVTIYHEHNREAYRNKKVMFMQIRSMIYYFNKWGWFFDRSRQKINNEIILKYKDVI